MTIFKKNSLLLLGFASSLCICYTLALQPTFALQATASKLKEKQRIHKNTLASLRELSLRNQQYDVVLKTYPMGNDASLQSGLLEIVNRFGTQYPLRIVSFKEPLSFKENNTSFTTYAFQVRAGYPTLVKLIYALEQEYKFGKIQAVIFEKKKNYKTHRMYLDCEIYIQRIAQ